MSDPLIFDSITEQLLRSTINHKTCFAFCKICQRSYNYTSKTSVHNCNSKPTESEQPKKTAIRKQNLDLNKHCGVIIGPSGVPCMRSLTCKSHSMASKRAVKNRIKDFDVLLNEYLQSHPPKNIPKTVSAAVNLDLMVNNEDEPTEGKLSSIADLVPFKIVTVLIKFPELCNIATQIALFIHHLPKPSFTALIINKCIQNNEVALTFEDGPSVKTTKKLLDLLDSLNVKATFHVVTKHFNYAQVQSLMSEIIDRGHVLGYRLEAEWTMQDVSTDGIQGAVDYRLEMIKKACGKKPKFVRTSYNATDLVKNALLASNLILTVPNFESYDYRKDFNIDSMLNRFDSQSLGSVITVQREFADNLFETTKSFVEHLRSKGYNIVTLQQCTGIEDIYFAQKGISPLKTYVVKDENITSAQGATTSSSARKLNAQTSGVILLTILMILVLL